MSSYQTSMVIPEFKGLLQQDDSGLNGNLKYAADGQNFVTRDGDLMPAMKAIPVETPTLDVGTVVGAGVLKKKETYGDPGLSYFKLPCKPNIQTIIHAPGSSGSDDPLKFGRVA